MIKNRTNSKEHMLTLKYYQRSGRPHRHFDALPLSTPSLPRPAPLSTLQSWSWHSVVKVRLCECSPVWRYLRFEVCQTYDSIAVSFSLYSEVLWTVDSVNVTVFIYIVRSIGRSIVGKVKNRSEWFNLNNYFPFSIHPYAKWKRVIQ